MTHEKAARVADRALTDRLEPGDQVYAENHFWTVQDVQVGLAWCQMNTPYPVKTKKWFPVRLLEFVSGHGRCL